MDIRDFIEGTPEEKDRYASRVLTASVMFATDLVLVIDKWADELPDGMKEDIGRLTSNFYGFATEYVDMRSLLQAAQSEEEMNDPTA